MRKARNPNKRTINQFKLLFVLFSAILITTGVIGYNLAARQAKQQLVQKCHALATTAAVIIAEDSDGYAAFLENMDMESSYYHDTKALMMKLKEVNVEHVAYIYTVLQVGENTAMYVIGGEPPDSPVYTAPGVTEDITDAWRTAFQEQRAVLGDTFVDTPYGARLSAYVPIFHRETGKFMGLVGADVIQPQYDSIMRMFVIQTAIGLFAGILVFAVAVWWLSGNVNLIINRERYEAAFARKIVSTGREHYQKMDEMYDRLRVLRHDYKYHLNATQKMLHAGDTAGADQYLAVVEKKLSGYEPPAFCPNHVINALMADYAERCARLNIQFDVSLNISEALSIPDYDLCIILGNLLENAVNACEKLERGRMIKLETQSIQNQLLFMIKNSFNGEIYHYAETPMSKKTNGGLGLRSVKEVVAGYNGDVAFEWDKDYFTAFVAVKL